MTLKYAPWTYDEVAALDSYQKCGMFHEYTSGVGDILIPTFDGWMDPATGEVTQRWCHAASITLGKAYGS